MTAVGPAGPTPPLRRGLAELFPAWLSSS